MKREDKDLLAREQYLLRSTFFYNQLSIQGYFVLFARVKRFVKVEGAHLDWSSRLDWRIGDAAWAAVAALGIPPALVFAHPKVLKLNPTFLRYYRSVALLPQRGLSTFSQTARVAALEKSTAESSNLETGTVLRLTQSLNEVISVLVATAHGLDERMLEGMMYVTAGTTIDGAWRNQIGAEGERVVKTIIRDGLLATDEVSSFIDKQNNTVEVSSEEAQRLIEDVDLLRCINLKNGYSVCFAQEPDVTFFNPTGAIVGVIEIKAGIDPAGALERLGAIFKSFENALAEYPEAVTILVASCITKEMDSRLNASMLLRQRYIMAAITADDREKRKFVNRLRIILDLTRPAL